MKPPQQIYVYVFDYDEKKQPMFGIANTIKDIPEANDGEIVWRYTLESKALFRIKREWKMMEQSHAPPDR